MIWRTHHAPDLRPEMEGHTPLRIIYQIDFPLNIIGTESVGGKDINTIGSLAKIVLVDFFVYLQRHFAS